MSWVGKKNKALLRREAEKIMPLLTQPLTGQRNTARSPEKLPVMSEYVSNIMIGYILDRRGRFQYIRQCDLDAAGMKKSELYELAMENFPKHIPDIGLYGKSPGYMLNSDFNFNATLLLLDPLWDKHLVEALPGEPLALARARDILLVSATGLPGGLEFLLKKGFIPLDDMKHPLSQQILVRRNGHWIPYKGR